MPSIPRGSSIAKPASDDRAGTSIHLRQRCFRVRVRDRANAGASRSSWDLAARLNSYPCQAACRISVGNSILVSAPNISIMTDARCPRSSTTGTCLPSNGPSITSTN